MSKELESGSVANSIDGYYELGSILFGAIIATAMSRETHHQQDGISGCVNGSKLPKSAGCRQQQKRVELAAAYGVNPYNTPTLQEDFDCNASKAYRVIAHMVDWLGERKPANTGRQPTQPQVQRVPDNGTAHGLRQHSIGSTYPAVVVGSISKEGQTLWHVEFAGLRTIKVPSAKQAQQWAEHIAQRYRIMGWNAAVNGLRGSFFYHGPVENRYA